MSTFSSPNVVNSGQTFYIDQNNTKSYLGPPIQNLSGNVTFNNSTATGISISGGYETVNVPGLGTLTATYSNIQNNYTSFTPNSADCCPSPIGNWGGFAVSPSTLYTYAIVYKVDSGYTNANYMYRYEYVSNGGAYVGEGGVFNDTNKVALGEGWFYAWGTFTTAATTNWISYAGAFYYRYSPYIDKLSIAKVLITPGNYSGLHPIYWPNKLTTRTNTSVFSNLVGSTSITANNLTYASDGTYSFKAYGQRVVTNISTFGNNATWAAWIKCVDGSASTYNMFMGRYLPYFSFYAGNRLYFSNTVGGAQQTIQTASDLSVNIWYYAVFTTSYDGANTIMKIYTNGVETATGTFAGAQGGEGGNSFTIGDGYDANWYRFDGFVSNVQIYNTTLSANQIQQNFNALRSRFGV